MFSVASCHDAAFAERRIFELPPDVDGVLRFHGRCVWGPGKAGCIVALLRDLLRDSLNLRPIIRSVIGCSIGFYLRATMQ